MSTIDERVVEMRFDNEQFQKGIEESIESLDNLKESLELDEATKSLEKLEKAGGDFSLDGVTKAVDEVQNKFNALEAVAFGVFANIGVQASNAALKVAKSFSIAQIQAGQAKYELKTKSVQAIQAALPDTDLSEIKEQLEELNWYTDQTSYDFAQMVSTIGKFTANGIGLEKSVKAMEGIANEAAKSGAGINEANRAMYNFAQALSSGSIKYIDWKSIELANMGTKEFKEQIIETAVALGQLKKAGDKIKTKKGTLVDFKTFSTTLSEGWFTSDVLVEVLNKYADRNSEFGKEAFEAAKIALTFTDAMNAVRDAVSTQWMATYELVFGDLKEAGEFFTDLCDSIIEAIYPLDEARNNLIRAWRGQDILDEDGNVAIEIDNEIDGRTQLINGLKDAFMGLSAVVESVKAAFADIFPSSINDKANTLIDLTTKFADAMHDFRVMLVNDTVINDLAEDDELILGNLLGMSKDTHYVSEKGEEPDEERRKITEVRQLAMYLKSLGYLGEEADKILLDVEEHGFSDTLSEKLKEFQKDVGYTESGIYDLNTAILLTQKLMAKTEEIKFDEDDIIPFLGLKKGDKNKDDIKALQDQLTELEYELGSSDGVFGKKTEAAVKKFQKDMGLAETGIIDVATATELYRKTLEKEGGIKAEFDYYGGTKTFDNLKRVFKPLAAAIKVVLSAMKAVIKTASNVAGSILKAFSPVLDVLAVIGDGLSAALNWFADSGVLDFIADWFMSSASFTADLVRYGAEALKWVFGFGDAVKSEDGKIHNFAQLIGYIVDKVKGFDIFGKISGHLNSFKEKLASSTSKLSEWFATFKANMDEKWQERFDTIVAGIDEFFAAFSGDSANSAAENGERTTTWITSFANAILTVSDVVETKCRKAADILSEFFTAFNGNSDRLQYRTGDEPWWVKLGQKAKKLSEWINSTSTKIGAKWSLFLYALRGETRASEKSPWYVKLGTQIRGIFDWIDDTVDRIKPKWEEFLSAFRGETTVDENSPWYVKAAESMQNVFDWIEEKGRVVTDIWNGFLLGFSGHANQKYRGEKPWYVTTGETVKKIFDWIGDKVESIQPTWEGFLSAFRGETTVDENSPWYVKVGAKVQDIWTWIEGKVTTVTTAWTDFLSAFRGDMEVSEDSPWWVKLGEKVQSLWTWIEEKVEAVKTAWTDFISTFSSSDGKPEDYQPWWVTVGYAFQDAWGWILEKVQAIKDAIAEVKKALFGGSVEESVPEDELSPETLEYYKNLNRGKPLYSDTGEIVYMPDGYVDQLSFVAMSFEMLNSTIEESTKGEEKKPWWWSILETLVKFSSSIGTALTKVQTAWQGFLSAFRGETEVNENSPWYVKLGKKVADIFGWINEKLGPIQLRWHMFLRALLGKSVPNEKSPWYVKLGGKLHSLFTTINTNVGKIGKKWEEFLIAFRGDSDRLQYKTGEEPWWIVLALKLKSFVDFVKREIEEIKTIGLGDAIANNFGLEHLSEIPKKLGIVFKTIKQKVSDFFKSMPDTLKKGAVIGLIGAGVVFAALLTNLLFNLYQKIMLLSQIPKMLTEKLRPQQLAVQSMGVMLLEIAGSILIIAYAIKMVGELDDDAFYKGLAFFGLSLAMLIGIFVAFQKLQKTATLADSFKSILSIGALVATILPLAAAMYILGTMSPEQLKTGGLAMLAIFAAIYGLNKLLNNTNVGIKVDIKGLLEVAGAIAILAAVAVLLGATSELAWRGVGVLAVIAIIVAGMIGIAGVINKFTDTKSMTDGLVRMAAAIAILSATVILLGVIPTAILDRGIVVLIKIMGLLAVFVAVMRWISDATPAGNKALEGFLGLAGAVAILAMTVIVLGVIPTEVLKRGIISLGLILLILGLYQLITRNQSPVDGKQTTKMFGEMTGIAIAILGFAYALKMIEDVKTETIVAFGSVLVAIVGTLGLLSRLRVNVSIKDAAKLGAAVGVFVDIAAALVLAMMTLVGQIEDSTNGGFSGKIDKAGDVLESIGQALGKFIGAFKDAAKASEGFDSTGMAVLATIVGVLSPVIVPLLAVGGAFLELIGALNHLTKGGDAALIKKSADVLYSIGYAIGSFIGGIQDGMQTRNLEQRVEEIKMIGQAMADFANVTKDIDLDVFDNVVEAFKKLVEVAKSIPKKGGWAQKIGGTIDFGDFASSLETFASGISSFVQTCKTIKAYKGTIFSDDSEHKGDGDAVLEVAQEIANFFGQLEGYDIKFTGNGGYISTPGLLSEDIGKFAGAIDTFVKDSNGLGDRKDEVESSATVATEIGDILYKFFVKIGEEDETTWDGQGNVYSTYLPTVQSLCISIDLFSNSLGTLLMAVTGVNSRAKLIEDDVKASTGIMDQMREWFKTVEEETTIENGFPSYTTAVNGVCDDVTTFSESINTLIEDLSGMQSVIDGTGKVKGEKNTPTLQEKVKEATASVGLIQEFLNDVAGYTITTDAAGENSETTLSFAGLSQYSDSIEGMYDEVKRFGSTFGEFASRLSGAASSDNNLAANTEAAIKAALMIINFLSFFNPETKNWSSKQFEGMTNISDDDRKSLLEFAKSSNSNSNGSFFDYFRVIGTTIGDFASNMEIFYTSISKIQIGDNKTGFIAKTKSAIEAATTVLGFLTQFATDENIIEPIKSTKYNGYQEAFDSNTWDFFTYIDGLSTSISEFYNKNKDWSGTAISDRVSDAITACKNILEAASLIVDDTYADPDDVLPEGKFSASSITEFTRFLGVFETLGSSLHTFMVSSDNFDTDEFTSISRSITSLVIALNKLASLTSDGFMDDFDEVAVSERIKTVASTLKSGADEGAATISGGTEEMRTAGNSLMASLSSGFENADGATSIVASASTIVGKVIKSMDGHADEATLIGKNLTIGLRLGLTDSTATNALYQAAKNVVKEAIRKEKEAADEASPSKETAWIGKYMDLGLVKGLNDYSGLVSKTAGGVSDDAIDAIRGAMTGVSNLIDSDISLDPVIRPVVDMSNVTSSSNAIDSMLSANRTVKLNTSRVASTFNRTAGIQNGSGSTSASFANDSSVNITGNQFVIRNEQDIRSLAHEIASYTNQQRRNLGLATR